MNIVLVVGNSSALSTGDTAVRNRLQTTLGHTVTIVDDNAAAPSLVGISLVLVAASSNQNFMSTKYDTATCGVLALRIEPHTKLTDDDFPSGGNTASNMYINMPGDPLVGGLSGNVTLTSGTPTLNYAYYAASSFPASAVLVGLSSNGSNRVLLARASQGATLVDGSTATTRRVIWGINDDWAPLFTTAAWTIFDNAVAWVSVTPGTAPVSQAGSDQFVGVGSSVQLSGSSSYDSDGTIASYEWRLVSTTGPSVTLSNTTMQSPTFTAPNTACTLVFGLRVTDNDGLAGNEDTVTINVIARMNIKYLIEGSWTDKPQYIAKNGSWY